MRNLILKVQKMKDRFIKHLFPEINVENLRDVDFEIPPNIFAQFSEPKIDFF